MVKGNEFQAADETENVFTAVCIPLRSPFQHHPRGLSVERASLRQHLRRHLSPTQREITKSARYKDNERTEQTYVFIIKHIFVVFIVIVIIIIFQLLSIVLECLAGEVIDSARDNLAFQNDEVALTSVKSRNGMTTNTYAFLQIFSNLVVELKTCLEVIKFLLIHLLVFERIL